MIRKTTEKIKNMIMLVWKKFLQAFAEYKITMALLMLWTITGCVCELYANSYREGIDGLLLFFLFFAMATLLAEIIFNGKPVKKGILCVAGGLVSGILTLTIHDNLLVSVLRLFLADESLIQVVKDPDLSDSLFFRWLMERADGFALAYLLLLIILLLYFGYKKSEIRFAEYLYSTFFNGLLACCRWFLFILGTMFLLFAIESLLLPELKNEWEIQSILMIVVTGLYFFPACIWAVAEKRRDAGILPKESIWSYVMTGFCICVMAVGYLYMVRLLLVRELPSNEVFTVITTLFVLILPEWLTMEVYKEKTVYSRLLGKLPYIFAPLIGLQVYSLVLRIGEYGITPSRYAGLMLILFEIIVIFVWRFRRDYCEILLPVMAVLLFISVFMPFINMYRVSVFSQEHIVKIYMQKLEDGQNFTEKEYQKLVGACEYLSEQPGGENLGEKYAYLEEMAEEIGIEKEEKTIRCAVHGCQMVGELSTEGYTSMHMLNQSEIYNDIEVEEADFSDFKFYKRENGEEIRVDLSEIYDKARAYEAEDSGHSQQEDSAYLKQFNRIEVDEDTVFYVNHFKMTYFVTEEGEVTEFTNVEISGMLLKKISSLKI